MYPKKLTFKFILRLHNKAVGEESEDFPNQKYESFFQKPFEQVKQQSCQRILTDLHNHKLHCLFVL